MEAWVLRINDGKLYGSFGNRTGYVFQDQTPLALLTEKRERFMFSRKLTVLLFVAATLLMSNAASIAADEVEIYNVETMAQNIGQMQGKEITVEATIVGACKSGCKMWIADGKYEEGNLFTLVRAKDDAFKFDTKSSGKTVRMTGFVVAKYKDYCGDKTEKDNADHTEKKEVAGGCAAPVKVEDATEGDLEEMTFFATGVEYIN